MKSFGKSFGEMMFFTDCRIEFLSRLTARHERDVQEVIDKNLIPNSRNYFLRLFIFNYLLTVRIEDYR
ncbi:MAG: hypothetical protein ACLPP9_10360 [Smithella sp.]